MPKKKSSKKISSLESFIDASSSSIAKKMIGFLRNQSKYIFFGFLVIFISICIAYMVTK